MSVKQLAELLYGLGLEPSEDDVLDMLWLASHLDDFQPMPPDATESARKPSKVAQSGVIGGAPTPSSVGAEQPYDPDDTEYAFYLRPADTSGPFEGISAAPVRVPAAPALYGQLNLTKALRPLQRKVASRHQLLLDEDATASRIAEDGLWLPALAPAPTRWLDLALVVDGYESMSIWRKAIAELRILLEGLGTFRDVRSWVLDHPKNDPARPGVRKWRSGSALRSPRELIDPAGSRVIVVVSDCLGPMWQSQAAQRVIAEWARRGPVAVMQPLPQRLWGYSHARPVAARLNAFAPGVPNDHLVCRPAAGSTVRRPVNSVPVPVLELNALWLAPWSRLLAASGTFGMESMVIFAGGETAPDSEVPVAGKETRTPHRRVRDFRATASPGAVRLAEFLAAAPISLPVIRLVQREVLNTPNPAHLAEVFLGGLLRRVDDQQYDDPDDVLYDFIPGVRETLIRRLHRADALRTLQAVSDFVGARFGQARDFRALLAGTHLDGQILISPDSRPFAQVAAQVLSLLGGQYGRAAVRLLAALPDVDTQDAPIAAMPDNEPPVIPAPVDLSSSPTHTAGTDPFATALAQVSFGAQRSKQQPLVCPYCYHAFAERDIHFRCAGRGEGGQASCPPEFDEKQEQMGQRAMLPPVFAADGRRDGAICPRCHLPTRTQVCPECHTLLPAMFRAVQGRLIALVGPSQAGKTAFMTVLIHEMRHEAGERLNSSTMGADETTQERFVTNYEWPMYEQFSLNLTPPKRDRIAPLVFRFTITQPSRFRPHSHELILSFADSAGEDLVSVDKVALMARYLAAADAVIVLIDPLQFGVVRDGLPLSTPLPSRAQGQGEPVAVFERITKLLLAGTHQEMIEKPVAIVLSKLDALWPSLPADHLLRKPRTITPYFENKDSLILQETVSTMLQRWGAADIERTARQRYKLFRFFAVSALGAAPTKNNTISQGIRPYRVNEPLLWILHQFGFIKSE